MSYLVRCECGNRLEVTSADAGLTIPCNCGAQVPVPSWSVLRQSPFSAADSQRSPAARDNTALLFAVTVLALSVAGFFAAPLLIPLGILIVIAARLWFTAQMLREMQSPYAVLAFFVPLLPTIFFLMRIDITWRPFWFGMLGYVAIFLGFSSLPSAPSTRPVRSSAQGAVQPFGSEHPEIVYRQAEPHGSEC